MADGHRDLLTSIPLMKRSTAKSGAQPSARPIEVVCVSPHKNTDTQAAEPDKLTMIRGKWAWCPSGAETGHDWKPVESGSLNELRVQLAEVSRLVEVALNTDGTAKRPTPVAKRAASKTNRSRSRGKR